MSGSPEPKRNLRSRKAKEDAEKRKASQVQPDEEQPAKRRQKTPSPAPVTAPKPADSTDTDKVQQMMEPIFLLRTQLTDFLNKMPKPQPQTTAQPSSKDTQKPGEGRAWGRLISQSALPSITLDSNPFSIRKSIGDQKLNLEGEDLAGPVCQLHRIGSVAFVKSYAPIGYVFVNNRPLKRSATVPIRSGDELRISSTSFVLQSNFEDSSDDVERRPSDGGGITRAIPLPPTLPNTPGVQPPAGENEESQHTPESLKALLTKSILDPAQDPTADGLSLDQFPYYLYPGSKEVLRNACLVNFQKTSYRKFATDITSLSPFICLLGPVGTELCQEVIVKALAREFNAFILPIDQSLLETIAPATEEPLPSPSMESLFEDGRRMLSGRLRIASETSVPLPSTRLTAKPKFRTGDVVVYLGGPPNLASRPPEPEARLPRVGSRGRVVVVFDDNPRRVGVRFDEPIPGGTSLGGLCPDGHGRFVEAQQLKTEGSNLGPTGAIDMLL